MTVQELIDKLNLIRDKSMLVAVEADHGQTPMKVTFIDKDYADDATQYMTEVVLPEDTKELIQHKIRTGGI